MIAGGWSAVGPSMAVSASPAARAVRTACFAEQMEQKKQLLLASSQRLYPPAFHSLSRDGHSFAAAGDSRAGRKRGRQDRVWHVPRLQEHICEGRTAVTP
jgi:hypothetical protein